MNELHRIFTAVALAVAITAPAPAADDTKPTNEEKLQQQKGNARRNGNTDDKPQSRRSGAGTTERQRARGQLVHHAFSKA